MHLYQLVQSDVPIPFPSSLGKHRCLVLAERTVSNEYRDEVSRLLVDNGCLFAMAWGKDCSHWDDSIDNANIAKFFPGDIPVDQFVMTTWHETDTLEEVIRFAKFVAVNSHADEPLNHLLVLDFATEDRADLIREIYEQVT